MSIIEKAEEGRRGPKKVKRAEKACCALSGPLRPSQALSGLLVGGVNSPVRAFRRVGASPVILRSGRGAWVTDTHGRRSLDFIMGWGALILGHNHPQVLTAIQKQLSQGTLLGLTTELEGQLAQAICEAIPSIERIRFTPSGTEACMTAIRLARAWTRRTKILTFEGCYHGHSDVLLGQDAGVPSSLAQEQLEAPYNNIEALEDIMKRRGSELAGVIVEPVAANMGVVVPDRGWLTRLRALTTTHGIVLIFDEIVTGFRLRDGGIQETMGVKPELTTLGKIIGGGFPVGAVGGQAAIMDQLAPSGAVYHAGTFAGHPVTMAAGLATLKMLRQRQPYERLEAMGDQLASGLREGAQRQGIAVHVNQIGSMLTVFFANTKQFAAFANGLRAQRVMIPPSPYETWFLSAVHTASQIEQVVDRARRLYAA
ncbi:MAG: glutamate-1-semialdehyde 2,1-aminomutase [Candidatus Omnitrophica bacterium]|nr:glutamate-1-semialdehyde 2,1-aminomutase [Candidatus Omnitrophota bacterium]